MHPGCSVEGLESGFLGFGRQQIEVKDFIAIEKCISLWKYYPINCN
jgi:hypothetical protein